MGLHYGCSLVAASLKGLQDTSSYQAVQSEAHYASRVTACAREGRSLPAPPSNAACVQPGNSLTAPLFAEVAGWTPNVRRLGMGVLAALRARSSSWRVFLQVSCWGEFDIYGRQLRSARPPGETIFIYSAMQRLLRRRHILRNFSRWRFQRRGILLRSSISVGL